MKYALLICALAVALPAQAAKDYGSVIVSRVGTVIDGDSFKVDIDEWPPIIGKAILSSALTFSGDYRA
jgi:micrococcal nuclease